MKNLNCHSSLELESIKQALRWIPAFAGMTVLFSCAHIKKEEWRAQLPIGDITPLKPIFPKAKKTVLKNGLTIYVVEDHKLPIADVRLVFNIGSSNDKNGKEGQINLTANMLKEGAGKYDALQMAERFAQLGTDVVVGTARDFVILSLGVLKSNTEKSIENLSLMAQKPLFHESDFLRLKRQVLTGLSASESNSQYLASKSFFKHAFGLNHPYADMTYGTIKSIEALSLKDIKDAHSQFFRPNNASLIVVGDVNLSEIKKQAKKYFSAWKKYIHPPLEILPPVKPKTIQTILINREGSPQSFLLVGQIAVKKDDPDLAGLEVLQKLLAGMPTSRLGVKLREEKGWTYGIQGQIMPFRSSGVMMLTSNIQDPFAIDSLDIILKEFDYLKNHLIKKEELDNAKDNILLSFAGRYSTLSQIGNSIANQFIYGLPENYDEKMYMAISNLTSQNIQKIAQKYLNKENTIAVAVGDLDMLKASFKNLKYEID